jgi:hypothetical protein
MCEKHIHELIEAGLTAHMQEVEPQKSSPNAHKQSLSHNGRLEVHMKFRWKCLSEAIVVSTHYIAQYCYLAYSGNPLMTCRS